MSKSWIGILELLAREKELGGVHIASHWINVFFLLGTSECAVVFGELTHPHVLPETHHTKQQQHAQTMLPIFPYLWCPTGLHLIIPH